MSFWFSLPVTKPDPFELADEESSSDPDWLLNRNFKDRLCFVPWKRFHEEVVKVDGYLCRLPKKDKSRNAISSLLEPMRQELTAEGWRDCWNESVVERQIAIGVWRAVTHARRAVLSMKRQQDSLTELSFVPQKEVRSERYANQIGKDLGRTVSISNPEHIIPDFCVFPKASDSRKNKSPLATVELKGSRAKVIHDHKDGYSAEEVAKNCQRAFDKRPLKEYLGGDFFVTKRLSQALTQAFHTESGSGALYNHVYAVFFCIEGKEVLKNGKTRIIVKVSSSYRCDSIPSNLHAFTAWMFLVEELAKLRRDSKTRKTQLLEAIEFVSTSSREHEDDDDSPPSPTSGDSSPSSIPSSSGTSSPVRKRQKGGGQGKANKKKNGSSSGSKKRTIESDYDVSLLRATVLQQKRLTNFESFLAMSRIVDAKKQVEAFRDDNLVRYALGSHIDLLGEGSFGIVRKVVLNGVSAAVKYCNRFTGNAQQYLHNEIVMNCYISSRFPHLMGSSVPKLIAVGFDDWAGPVLITEMVGNSVNIEEGRLKIGREWIHPKLSWIVRSAAMDGLKALHSCGIVHRDVRLDNLRAILRTEALLQDQDSLSVDDFHAWWVDLGFSDFGSSSHDFGFELEQCVSLFSSIQNRKACVSSC